MASRTADGSRIAHFYRFSVSERLRTLFERGLLSEEDYHSLLSSQQVLSAEEADRLIENVIGVFSLPLGLGLNFQMNSRDYLVPFAVEEPSIVAAVSSAAKTVRRAGGFNAACEESLLIGQIQVVDVPQPAKMRSHLLQHHEEILDLANSLHPKMVARGGGAREVEVHLHPHHSRRGEMVVVHLLVDTRDAMGANLVNTMCEGVAPLIEKITGGTVFLRIISNLTDRSMVRAEVEIPTELLGGRGFTGDQVRDGIILATEFATVDPYRAATHNKGILNGIDAVAIATGNDWRAIDAAAHAYAGRGHGYTSLTKWYANEAGDLIGSLELPLKVGIVGGQVQSNPAVAICHRLVGVESAPELAQVMACVGLAQNFAALRALSTDGIQRGHMMLHARSCAVAAGAPPEVFERVVERLIECGDIKVWKAEEIMVDLSDEEPPTEGASERIEEQHRTGAGHGKVILLGEHAVVYGSHAIAAPIPLAIQARVQAGPKGGRVMIPRWGVESPLRDPNAQSPTSIHECLNLIFKRLEVEERDLQIEIFSHVPRAMGLGGSAALAVAVTRAISDYFELQLVDKEINDIAYACEQIIHGTPSGIDNALATYGRFLLYRKSPEPGEPAFMETLEVPRAIPIVIGLTGVESLTARMVAQVRRSWENKRALYERIFSQIDGLTLEAVDAIAADDLPHLGELMNVCHGLLNALQVSSPELEELIGIARRHGALGAKLTGGGGGGSMIALCPHEDPAVSEGIASAMRQAGYRAIQTEID